MDDRLMDNNRRAVTAGQSTQLSTFSERPNKVTPAEFAKEVTPLLTLVAPTGMTQEERKGWLHAAHMALGDMTPAALSVAVREAMRTVDHPAKIVSAIRKASEGGYVSTVSKYALMPTPTPKPEPVDDEVRQLMNNFVAQLEGKPK